MNNDKQPQTKDDTEVSDRQFLAVCKVRASESDSYYNEKLKLKTEREKNEKRYLGTVVHDQVIDDRYEEVYSDNRQFVAVRTILPILTSRLTSPNVTAADDDDVSLQFAKDFKQILVKQAEKQKGVAKVRLMIQDGLRGKRVGVGKWHYDAKKDTIVLSQIDPKTVRIGKRSRLHEEPDYLDQQYEYSVGQIISRFPNIKDKLFEELDIDEGDDDYYEKLEEIKTILERWVWIDDELIVGWTYQEMVLGKTNDPNWDDKHPEQNIADQPMIPYFFFNFLNDGSSYIDETSFIEQARFLQSNYNKRGQTISDNAKYGGIGVPIFAKGAIQQKDVSKIRFSPIQRVLLNTDDVNKAFGVWKAQDLPSFMIEDKNDQRVQIDNIWGNSNVLSGGQSDQKTATQDILTRNQGEGRMSDLSDCIDVAMERCYIIEAQLMYRYFSEDKYYKIKGKDGKPVKAIISRQRLVDNAGIEISVDRNTNLPIDRSQRKATLDMLIQAPDPKVATLTYYKETNLFDDPEAAYEQLIKEKTDPAGAMQDAIKAVYDREAQEDIDQVIAGQIPDEPDDIGAEYINYMNEWLLDDKFMKLQQKDPEAAHRVSQFIDAVIAKAKRKVVKLSMQAPNPLEVQPQQPGAPGQPPTGAPPVPPGLGPTPPPPGLPPENPGIPQMPAPTAPAQPGAIMG